MPSCELCGRSMKGNGRNVVIEGASMLVCPQCAAKFGQHHAESSSSTISRQKQKSSWLSPPERQSVSDHSSPAPRVKSKPKPKPQTMGVRLEDMELVEDYAKIILLARQRKGMSQDELAQRIGESISTLKAIEAGRQKPIEKTIRGLERELDISLLESIGTAPIKSVTSQAGGGPTLGDRVIVKRKASQKSLRESDKSAKLN